MTMDELTLWTRLRSFVQFLNRWGRANWRSLLLLLVGIYLPLLIFALLAFQIVNHEGGLTWDVAIMTTIHARASARLDAIVPILTDFATYLGVIPLTAVLSLTLLYQRRWRSLTYLLLAILGCGLINQTAKALLHRVRPSLWDYPHLQSFSFPSGHAMVSMCMVAALVIMTWGSRWCGVVLALGSVFVVTIGWTRLYLGVHYPSDVLAGWMMSIAWAVGVSIVVKPQLITAAVAKEEAIAEG